MRSEPRRKTPPVVSPIAGPLSHVEKRKKGRARARPRVGKAGRLDRSPTDQQVVDDADDRQHQQEMDQATADLQGNAQQPQDEEDDNDRPDQASHRNLPELISRYVIARISV